MLVQSVNISVATTTDVYHYFSIWSQFYTRIFISLLSCVLDFTKGQQLLCYELEIVGTSSDSKEEIFIFKIKLGKESVWDFQFVERFVFPIA